MNNQIQSCDADDKAVNSLRQNAAVQEPQLMASKPRAAWKSVARFLSQAAVGGGLGFYDLMIGMSVYTYRDKDNLLLIMLITLPFGLIAAAFLGLLTGSVTLLVENLIEEKLSTLARMIVTSAIVTLIVFGVSAVHEPASWQLLKLSVLPGAILGLPIGLIAGSRLRLFRVLLLGVDEPPGAEATSLSYGFALIGGFALRLVSVVGTLMAVMVLACTWKFQKTDELLVTIFGIYYFACSTYVTCRVRQRWVMAAAGTFLNSLLLLLALFWDPYTREGLPGPFTIVFFVLALLWMLFVGGHLGIAPKRRELSDQRLLKTEGA